MSSPVKEPLFHVVKRDDLSFVRSMMVRLIAIVLALIVCAVVIVFLTGMNPLNVYAALWDGAVGTSRRMWITLRDAAILLCIGFAVMPAFRMRFWNTGAEGQVLVGAMATAAVMIYGKALPTWALYTLCPLAGIAAGAIWGIIPAFFKAHWNTNETLFTLMLNYIATQLVAFGIIFWENPPGSNSVGLINAKGKIGWLPNIGKNSYLLPILIVVGLALVLFVYMRYTKQGYEISVVGESENTAHYAAINVKRVIIRGHRGLPAGSGRGSHHFHRPCGRTRLYRHYCCVAGQAESLCHDAGGLRPCVHGKGRAGNCQRVQPERKRQ